MKNIDRFNLIDTIGRELQLRMTYSDINIYLKGFGIDAKAKTQGESFGSKWVYSKEVLSNEPDDIILSIAEELELEHPYGSTKRADLSDSKFWLPNHFRLFLTHLSSFKSQTSKLQKALKHYGISGFVAHEDIEPTKEWLTEIEKALFSMDALVAILMPGFHESNWTDHEVGVAVGRDALVIPIRRGLDPYGFIGKYQGLQAKDKTVGQVSSAIFDIILSNPKTKGRMLDCLVDQFLLSGSVDDANRWLKLIGMAETLPERHGEKIIENFPSNNFVSNSEIIRKSTNELLKKHGMSPVPAFVQEASMDDEIPF
ncbi:MAG: toll/interleukin-1 receptor domain-containing protein [Proteobacteria bacterium]|nr:toll/interleukin-1 receptor domain-containing protein [Pseudomonadota bacterium]MBU4504377.1 toll/interleukin-1 receptor domain-containing protein [Pseudomonadota bacterium]MCG2759054.1 toll/interleukin-1 receptor domain-containing protein [Desulfobacteraceae bacterium]